MIPAIFCVNCHAFLNFKETVCFSCQAARSEPWPTSPDQPIWQVHAGGPLRDIKTLPGNRVAVLIGGRAREGEVRILNQSTGEQINPRFVIPHPIENGWAIKDEYLYLGTLMQYNDSARLICLDLADGAVRWQTTLHGGVWSTPVVTEARIYAGTDSGMVQCVDRRSGAMVPGWGPPGRKGRTWPAMTDLGLLVLHESGEVDLLDPLRGSSMWIRPLTVEGTLLAPPVIAGSNAYFGTLSGDVYSIDLRRAMLQHLFGGLKRVTGRPAIAEGILYAGGHDHRLHAWDLRAGRLFWRSETFEHSIASPPSVSEGLVAVCINGGEVILLDAITGRLHWRYRLPIARGLMSDPLLAEGIVYAGSDGGHLAALPWHLGHYADAGTWLSGRSDWLAAGSAFAHAAQLAVSEEQQDLYAQKAAESWAKTGAHALAGSMWESAGYFVRAAKAFVQAGKDSRLGNSRLAADYYNRAAALYWREGLEKEELENRREAARLDKRPLLRLKEVNVPVMTQRKAEWLSFRVENIGFRPARNLHFTLGGSLVKAIEVDVQALLLPDDYLILHLEVTPTRPEATLKIDTRYDSDPPGPHSFTTSLSEPITIQAGPPPHYVKIGDSVGGKFKISNASGQPVELDLGDQIRTEVEIFLT